MVFHGTLNGSTAYRAAVLARTGNVFHGLFPKALAYSMARVLFARAQRLALSIGSYNRYEELLLSHIDRRNELSCKVKGICSRNFFSLKPDVKYVKY